MNFKLKFYYQICARQIRSRTKLADVRRIITQRKWNERVTLAAEPMTCGAEECWSGEEPVPEAPAIRKPDRRYGQSDWKELVSNDPRP